MAIRHKYSRVRKLYSVIVNYYNKHIPHITIISHQVNMKNVELSSRIEQAQSTLFLSGCELSTFKNRFESDCDFPKNKNILHSCVK